jgi:AraC-like DNA-binding protein
MRTVDTVNTVVRAGGLRGFDEFVRDLGGDPKQLLTRHGIEIGDDAEVLISLDSVARLLEDSADTLRCPHFGLGLAERQDPGVLGLLAIVMRHAQTVESAIADASRYLLAHSPAYTITLDQHSPVGPDCATLRFEARLDDHLAQRQLIDSCLATAFKIGRAITAAEFRVEAVSLPHTPLAPAQVYRDYFHAPVHFEQPYAGLHARRHLLGAPLKHAQPAIYHRARADLAQRFTAHDDRLSDRVRHALVASMGAAHGTKSDIASLLGLHPRTLQRHLARDGETFEAIREELYRTTAQRYLRETHIPLAQIAAVMGFSEHSSFTRTCRRWFGKPPSHVRAEKP